MIKVRIPSPMRPLTRNADVVECEGTTVGDVLDNLVKQFPDVGIRLFKEPNIVNRYINVFLGEDDVRFLQNLETPVSEGQELALVPAVAGG